MKYQTKTLPSGIVIENIPENNEKYRWLIKGTNILHNEGDLAVENISGKFWLQQNKYHRLDGAAIEYTNGYKSYCINTLSYKEEDYWNHPAVKEYIYLKEHPELESFL